MCTSTSVVSTPGNRHCTLAFSLHPPRFQVLELDLCNINIPLKFTAYHIHRLTLQFHDCACVGRTLVTKLIIEGHAILEVKESFVSRKVYAAISVVITIQKDERQDEADFEKLRPRFSQLSTRTQTLACVHNEGCCQDTQNVRKL